jgi:hypothetical protein
MFLLGFSFPLSLIIPNTKMAESTEFIIEISTNIPNKKVRLCSGKYSRKTNNEVKTLLNWA